MNLIHRIIFEISLLFDRILFELSCRFKWGKSPKDESPEIIDGWIKIYSGYELLGRPEIAPYVEEIKRRFHGTFSQTLDLIDSPLDRLASLVQLLPASADYHHFERGGLLKHLLDCMAMAASANYQIHQMVDPKLVRDNVPPDMVFYTEYCFQLRALTHDVGKLQTMFLISLLIERADGSFIEELYDPMDGGFGAVSLEARAEREKCNGARSVRYRYTFRRGASMHDHEAYWEDGIQRLLRGVQELIPGRYFALHLARSKSFLTHLRPKVAEIDHRSVVKYQSRSNVPASQAEQAFRRLLHDLATHPQLQSAELVRCTDGQQRLFLPHSVVQVYLNELPDTYADAFVPRHPDLCLRKLKASGLTDGTVTTSGNRRHFDEYNGRTGVFLNSQMTIEMLGAPFITRVADNVSARLGDLLAPLPAVAAAPGPVLAAPLPPTSSAMPSTNLEATPASGLLPQVPPQPSTPRSEASAAPRPRSLIEALAQHLESLSPEVLNEPDSVTLRDGCYVFSGQYLDRVLLSIAREHQFSAADFRHFRHDSAVHCQEKWRLVGDDLVCTLTYSALIRRDVPAPTSRPPVTQGADLPGPSARRPPDSPPFGGRDYEAELAGLMQTIRNIYRQNGERLMETDGLTARVDFRAIDTFTGDKQQRGRVLKMLRHLGLYLYHHKNSAVVIRSGHPTVKSCLADLQQKK